MRRSVVPIVVAVVGSWVLGVAAPAGGAPAGGGVYYVDPANGDDTRRGDSAANAWRTLARVNEFRLEPGDTVLFRRGSTWRGGLHLTEDGTAEQPVVVGSYGTGAAPVFTAAENCVTVDADHQIVEGIRATGCDWAGVELRGSHNEVRDVQSDNNVAGVVITEESHHNTVRSSTLVDNNRMSVDDPGGDDDSGAFGVLLNGDDNVITGNTITGSFATSHDYGYDGAAVEVYNGDRNQVTYNVTANNETFTELGISQDGASEDNVFAYNTVYSDLPRAAFLVTRGAEDSVGPVTGTVAVNNSVQLLGQETQGWVCYGGCAPSILKLRNNIVAVTGKTGYEDGEGADEDRGVYFGTVTQFEPGPNSVEADPRYVSRTDLHLRADSPAIGRGEAAGFTHDLDGTPLPATPDAGAYQRP
jgi:copper-binding protein NosD